MRGFSCIFLNSHPDHLGSSSYITNLAGEINQHMEYLPFGELLVEEHLNSYNSPFKFNAKEFDAETGNYYYGARYYDPKWVIWLSVDAEFARFPSYSPYNYTLLNPVRYIDPDGNSPFDHYFSKNGRYLGSDNRSTNNIRVMQNSYGASGVLLTGFDAEYAYNNSTTLSSFNYSDKKNVGMLKNIASHYQNEVGLSANGPMDVRDHDRSVMHVVGDGPAINVSRQLGTTISQFLDDANNFMNTIIHEDGHRWDGSPTNFEHTSNYLTQSKHDTWMDTTTEYKNAMSTNTANLLNRAIKEDGVSKQAIQNRVNEFNSVPFGIQLHYNENANSITPVTQLEPVNVNNN